MKKSVLFFLVIIVFSNFSFAQEADNEKLSLNVGADIINKYVWRGAQLGSNFPSVQPYVELGAGPFVAGFFNSISLSGVSSFQEIDFYVGANFYKEMFSVFFFDYYIFAPGGDYFDFNNNTTGHVLEVDLSFNGTEKLPINVLYAINVYGADALKIEDDISSPNFNSSTGIKYSSYLELSYIGKIGHVEYKPFVAANLTNSKLPDLTTGYVGETGYYGEKQGIVHAGFKLTNKIPITDKFSLPVFGQISVNTLTRDMFFVFGISL